MVLSFATWKSLPNKGTPTDASLEHIFCHDIISKDYKLVRTCLSHDAQLNESIYGAVARVLTIDLMRLLIPAGLDVNHQNDRTAAYVSMTASGQTSNSPDSYLSTARIQI